MAFGKEKLLLRCTNFFAVMDRFVYVFFIGMVGFLKILPFRVLYVLSDGLYFLLFYLFGYRRKVVFDNLTKSFPEQSPEEIRSIAKKFYRHLCDITVESLKGLSMSNEEMVRHYHVQNPEVANRYFEQGRDIICLASHYGNWEWGIQAVALQFEHEMYSLYKPLSNQYVEAYSLKKRRKGKMNMVSIKETRQLFESEKEKPAGYIMAADQSPSSRKKSIWVNFLGRETACLHGPEAYAKRQNLAIIYFDVQRIRRGFYTLTVRPVLENPAESDAGEVTTRYMQILEEVIRKKPEHWLWSHRRWKHTQKPDSA